MNILTVVVGQDVDLKIDFNKDQIEAINDFFYHNKDESRVSLVIRLRPQSTLESRVHQEQSLTTRVELILEDMRKMFGSR